MSEHLRKLAEVAEINPRRKTIERTDDTLTSFVPMEAVDDVLGDVTRVVSQPFSKVKKGYTYFENGDVIFAKITPCMQNGKHAVVSDLIDGFGFGSTEFHVVRASSEILPEWIHYFLRRKETLDAAIRTFTGAVGQQRVPPSFLENLELPVPQVAEQRRIATCLKAQLAEAETARQAAQAQVRDAALLQRRLLHDAFDQIACEPTTLGHVLKDIETGKSFQTAEVLARPEELGVLKVSAVSWAHFRADQAKALKGDYKPADSHRVKQGDLLISRANTRELVGAVVLVGQDHPMRLLSDKTLRLVVDESNADKDYLLFALRADIAREHIELYATGTSDSMRNISQDVIASTPVVLPPLADQRRIVTSLQSQLAEADAIAQAAAAQLAEIERLPRRILALAFES
ncbi:MAG: restriction endonuclease subunit S [Burkholderiales bacterium]|nr:restriction endonuclease subunit S [Burkholderiales bacterium]